MRWLLLLLAGVLPAQRPVPPRPFRAPISTIAGRVTDAGSGVPLTGAAVFVRCIGQRGAQEELTLLTSLNGTFSTRMFNEQGCVVSVRAEGYVESREETARGPVRIRPAAEGPAEYLSFALHQEAELSGTVIDRTTEKPVAGITVWAQWSEFERGKQRLRAAADAASTDAEGRFRLRRLPPGKYFLQLMRREQERIEGRARPAEKLDGYARTFWPGGADEAAVPLWVYAGARLDAGALFVERQPLYRIHASIRTPLCAPGRNYRTVLWQQQGPEFVPRANDALPCGVPFTVHNLTAGAWWLDVRLEGAAAPEADSALVPLEVRDQDLRVQVEPLPALKIQLKTTGRGAGALTSAAALLVPAGSPAFFQPPPEALERGVAVLAAPAAEKVELRLLRLDPQLAVAGIRYNGGSTDDGIFAPNRSAPSQLLEVEVTDHPSVLSGAVKDGQRAVGGALVVAAPWPSALRAAWPRTYRIFAAPDGAFSFPALAPGAYRVFAVDAGLRPKLEEPGVLLRLIGNAAGVELQEGGNTRLDLQPVEP